MTTPIRKIQLGLAATCLAVSTMSYADAVSFWDTGDWNLVTEEDMTGSFNQPNPGYGGQAFDAEFIYYKVDANTLTIGVQTGFDIVSGTQVHGTTDYWGGDLALSFDGVFSSSSASDQHKIAESYEYGVDFGLLTKDINQHSVNGGTDAAGFYQVTNLADDGEDHTGWNTDISFRQSSPFAIENGTLKAGIAFGGVSGVETYLDKDDTIATSYWRTVDLNLALLGAEVGDLSNIDVHWTMSCGNDAIGGNISVVPLPAAVWLFGTVLLAMGGYSTRRKALISA